MGDIERHEIYRWAEHASIEDLRRKLNAVIEYLDLPISKDQADMLRWIKKLVLEEISARNEINTND